MPSRPPAPPSGTTVPRATVPGVTVPARTTVPRATVPGAAAPRTAVVQTGPRTAVVRSHVPRTVPPRVGAPTPRPTTAGRPRTAPPGTAPRSPQDVARARARAKAAAARVRAERRSGIRARRRAALTRWTHRTGAVGGALLVVLVAAVVLSGVQPGTPAAASAPLDLTARATALRDELTGTTTELQTAQAGVDAAVDGLATAEDDRDTAATALAAARATVGAIAADLYSGTPTDRMAGAGYPVGADGATAGSLSVLADRADEQLAARTAAADAATRDVDVAARRVDTARTVLAAARQQVTEVTAAARRRAAAADLTVTATLAGLGTTTDETVRSAWQARLQALAAAGIELPTASQLLAGDLPTGLTPAHDAAGATIPGVAAGVVDGAVVTVPSAEAAATVSLALARIGTPYAPGGTTPAGLDCAGLAAAVWTATGTVVGAGLADQWSAGALVPAGRLQAGDLVFGIDPVSGLDDVGVYVGDGQLVSASARTGLVGTGPVAADAPGVRVTVPAGTPTDTPPGTGTAPPACGAEHRPGGPSVPRGPVSVLAAVESAATWAGGSIAAVVLDAPGGTLLSSVTADQPVATASLVKLLVAQQVLADTDPGAGTLDLLRAAIEASDDAAMNTLWVEYRGADLVTAAAAEFGLTGTAPPTDGRSWGQSTTTATDYATVLADYADHLTAPDAALLTSWLQGTTPTAADGFDQDFGVRSLGLPGTAAKQGWMCCVAATRQLHSTGVLADGRVVVLLGSFPSSTTWSTAATALDSAAAAVAAGT